MLATEPAVGLAWKGIWWTEIRFANSPNWAYLNAPGVPKALAGGERTVVDVMPPYSRELESYSVRNRREGYQPRYQL